MFNKNDDFNNQTFLLANHKEGCNRRPPKGRREIRLNIVIMIVSSHYKVKI